MNNPRNAHERLDALLSALEDEVMSGEGILATDVKAMRAEIEDLIERHAGRGIRGDVAHRTKGAKGKTTFARELMGRLVGIGHSAVHSKSQPRLRMAYSGKTESSEVGERTKSTSSSESGEKGE